MSEKLVNKYDECLNHNGPAALVIREYLVPVEGADAVLFPATFAPAVEGSFKGGYNIDEFSDGSNVCLIDSVGSQSNRIEPLFIRAEYCHLVPQVIIKAGEHQVNLLEAGHRAGDAIVRCSELKDELKNAFIEVQKGNCEPLARIAPTSIVFGVWDSRGTQVKLPRLISSTIRAYNVHKLTRSAQYIPPVDYVENGLIEEPTDKHGEEMLASRGFKNQPASAAHGGVIARGGVRRDAALHLSALRLLTAGEDEKKTLKLRRYILGLALTVLTKEPSGYLRQGCNLVQAPDRPREFVKVYPDGRREPAGITHEDAMKFAREASQEFGVKEACTVSFEKLFAQREISGEDTGDRKSRKSNRKTAV